MIELGIVSFKYLVNDILPTTFRIYLVNIDTCRYIIYKAVNLVVVGVHKHIQKHTYTDSSKCLPTLSS